MKLSAIAPRLILIVSGVALGLLARLVLGVPESEDKPIELTPESRQAIEQADPSLPVIRVDRSEARKKPDKDQNRALQSGVVPPIAIPGSIPQPGSEVIDVRTDLFPHDPEAIFHSHGDKVCASGCAASNHPTETLTRYEFNRLTNLYANGSLDSDNEGLEALLYYGPQTTKMIQDHGISNLDDQHAKLLWDELKCQSVRVSLRVVDQEGNVRSWLNGTSVPFDRRHVFDMKTNDLQPLVTSGTVKRVGLNHNWVRL